MCKGAEMKNKIAGKVVFITGASSGIGLALANKLTSLGAIVYGVARSKCQEKGFVCYECDVNDSDKMEQILKEVFEKEGKLDVFVNNAGYGIAGAICTTQTKSIYDLVDTNLSAVINLSAKAIPYLKQSKDGRIINISSIGGIVPLPYQAVYSATKAGVDIFSRALANEVKPFGIKVSVVMPGDIKTGFTANRKIEGGKEDDEYSKSVALSIKKVEKDEQTGKGPEGVVKVICKAITKKNPPLKVSVGFWYKCVTPLVRFLPTKMVNWIVEKLYCKKAK